MESRIDGKDQKLYKIYMAKKKRARKGHQSFKMTPHKHSQDRVLMYVISAAVVGVVVGFLFREQVSSVLGISTLAP